MTRPRPLHRSPRRSLRPSLRPALDPARLLRLLLLPVALLAPAAACQEAPDRAPGADHADTDDHAATGDRAAVEDRAPGWRLAHEASPYLRQHADNLVEWYPWGQEAFDLARERDVPVFLSIGYSSCHWCHVMEHESFEHAATGAYLAEHFVSIKVDREQRPDVDERYMDAVVRMTGSGGWPLTVFLTPDGLPFGGGTYFPLEPRGRMLTFRQLLESVVDAWTNDRVRLVENARAFDAEGTGDRLPPVRPWEAPSLLAEAGPRLAASLDPVHGGRRSTRPQRFPPSMVLRALAREELRTGGLDLAGYRATLDGMALGGMRDQVGGGFHRYSTDPRWEVPHFEKMLYDNALLAATYAEAYALEGLPRDAEVARDTLRWLQDDMRSPEGLYYAARDADSLPFGPDGRALPDGHPEEGDVYTWTRPELVAALGAEDVALFAKLYDLPETGGNFERGRSIPRPVGTLHQMSLRADLGVPQDGGFEAWHADVRGRLLAVRAGRPQAFQDEKALAAWNGLTLSAFARCGRLLPDAELAAEADHLAAALAEHLLHRDPDGALAVHHQWFEGEASGTGLLFDWAALGLGYLDAYETTGDPRWLVTAHELATGLLDRFADAEGTGFYDSEGDDPLLAGRRRSLSDGAVPSAHALALELLQRLAPLDDGGRFQGAVDAALDRLAPVVARSPDYHASYLAAVDAWEGPLAEVVLAGAGLDAPEHAALFATASRRLQPAALLVADAAAAAEALAVRLPEEPALLAGRRVDAGARAWVCRRGVCLLPVDEPGALAEQLDGLRARSGASAGGADDGAGDPDAGDADQGTSTPSK